MTYERARGRKGAKNEETETVDVRVASSRATDRDGWVKQGNSREGKEIVYVWSGNRLTVLIVDYEGKRLFIYIYFLRQSDIRLLWTAGNARPFFLFLTPFFDLGSCLPRTSVLAFKGRFRATGGFCSN